MALGLALIIISVVETSMATTGQSHSWAQRFILFSLSMGNALAYLLPGVCFALGLAVLLPLPRNGIWGGVRAIGAVAICIAVVVAIYRTLVIYAPFEGYPPFLAGAAFGAVSLIGIVYLWNRSLSRDINPSWMVILSAVLLLSAGALHLSNYHYFHGYYPTLHLAVMEAELVALFTGLSGFLISLKRMRFLRSCSVLSAAIVLGAAATGWLSKEASAVLPEFVDFTVLGQSRTVFSSFDEARSEGSLFDSAGPERFHRLCGLPEPPDGFVLEDYNILLVMSEATRFDQTSLFDAKLGTTPNLLARSEDALVFTRAYAPSSGTLHSLASIMTMSYPSMISMETWMKVWTGKLYPQEETVAETLKQAGYDTFWVGYNHWFPKNLLGFEQGFDQIELIPDDPDSKIAARAVDFIEERAGSDERFFGWVFFVSPHGPYQAHGYEDMPNESPIDRYHQEIRFVDDQLEKIFEALERAKILDKTIVIYTGDHGEEFREHGGTRHKTTVYGESIQVPLVVRIPGMTPGRPSSPTSTAYVFPWLFSHAKSVEVKKRFEARARGILGPMLRETRGAVVVELMGHNKMRSSLIWKDLKVNYDFISRRVEFYRPDTDRLEKHNLFGKDPDLQERATSMLEAYKKARSIGYRHVSKPKKRPPVKE